jgi:hypothetical protein
LCHRDQKRREAPDEKKKRGSHDQRRVPVLEDFETDLSQVGSERAGSSCGPSFKNTCCDERNSVGFGQISA